MHSAITWTDADTEAALKVWAEYQRRNDVSGRVGQVAGIDPSTGRVWFGESPIDIWHARRAEGLDALFYSIRVGDDCYVRKGVRN